MSTPAVLQFLPHFLESHVREMPGTFFSDPALVRMFREPLAGKFLDDP
jgi:hypothetical protein